MLVRKLVYLNPNMALMEDLFGLRLNVLTLLLTLLLTLTLRKNYQTNKKKYWHTAL